MRQNGGPIHLFGSPDLEAGLLDGLLDLLYRHVGTMFRVESPRGEVDDGPMHAGELGNPRLHRRGSTRAIHPLDADDGALGFIEGGWIVGVHPGRRSSGC